MFNPLGIGTSVITLPETVVMGLESGNASPLRACLKLLYPIGWNRRTSCSHKPRVNPHRQFEGDTDEAW
jgi:hypothetical protein